MNLDYGELSHSQNKDDAEIVWILSDHLTDVRYLFETIGVALQAYEDMKDNEKMYYLNGAYKVAMEKLRSIEDCLAEVTPLQLEEKVSCTN